MKNSMHELAQKFFAALTAGNLPDELLTQDCTAWTTSSNTLFDKARYQSGVKMLAAIFNGAYVFTVDSLIAEGDKIAAEVHAAGTLNNGQPFSNRYVFILRINDGRIASVAEHFDPTLVREKLVPLIQALMTKNTPPPR